MNSTTAGKAKTRGNVENSTKGGGEYELDIVVPIHNEELNLKTLIKELELIRSEIGIRIRILLIDDGSNDQSWPIIQSLLTNQKAFKVVGVKLKRNYGQMHAFDCGLELTSANFVVTMDGDLQHPPEFVKNLWDNRSSNQCVAARQIRRKDKIIKRILSTAFYPIISRLSKVNYETNVSDFRLIPRNLLVQILENNDSPRIMRFLIPKLGLNQIYLDYEPADRLFGYSKYSLRKMYDFATYSLVATTNSLLRLSLKAAFAYALFSMAVFIYGLTIMISGNGIPGYLSILFTLTISFSGLFLIVGIFGLYLEKLLDSASRIRVDVRSKIDQIVGD